MYQDHEINALSNVYEALKGLNNAQIKRIIDWAASKFELDSRPGLKAVEAVEREVEPSPPLAPVDPAETAVKPEKKRRGRPPVKMKPTIEKPVTQPAAAVGITGFMKFDSLQEIFLASTVKTTGAKILLASAYLQETENFKELSSYDITSRMKNIGQTLKNASIAVKSLMLKKPPMLIQTGTFGYSKQSRKKFRVTEEGLRIARNYINE
jgi:hypothetical protein